jgi:hypothetical protein
MTLLPIVERELQSASRRAATYRNRMLVPILVAAVAVVRSYLFAFPSSTQFGRDLFDSLAIMGLVICGLEGVRKTADCVSVEKREGTLGLLFLTDLKGYDVVLGKLAAFSLASIYGLMAALPILLTSLLLGSVTFGEILRTVLALLNVMLFSQSVGIWVSARSRSASQAMAGTTALVLLFLVVPIKLVPAIAPASPAYAFVSAPETVVVPVTSTGMFAMFTGGAVAGTRLPVATGTVLPFATGARLPMYSAHWPGYWGSLLLTQLYVLVLLASASARVRRFREEEGMDLGARRKESGASTTRKGNVGWREKQRLRILDSYPVAWLAGRNASPGILVWGLVLVTGAGIGTVILQSGSLANTVGTVWPLSALMTYTIVVLGVNALMKTLLAARACRCLAEARQNSTLEILLCAPLQVEEILQGQMVALRRMFLRTSLLLLTFEMIGLIWILHGGLTSSPWAKDHEFGKVLILGEGAFAAFFLLELQGVAWAGIWFGLCSQNASRAMFKTLFAVVVLPLLLLVLPCVGAALYVIWPVVSYAWARLKLQEQFRELAGQRSVSTDEKSNWIPFRIPKIVTDPTAEA